MSGAPSERKNGKEPEGWSDIGMRIDYLLCNPSHTVRLARVNHVRKSVCGVCDVFVCVQVLRCFRLARTHATALAPLCVYARKSLLIRM